MVHQNLECIHTSTQRCAVCKCLHFDKHCGHMMNTLHSTVNTRVIRHIIIVQILTYCSLLCSPYLSHLTYVFSASCTQVYRPRPTTDNVQLCRGIPGWLHVGPLYPLGHWQVSLATHTPLSHGGSHTTETRKRKRKTKLCTATHAQYDDCATIGKLIITLTHTVVQ